MDKRSRRGASASQPDNDGNDPCDTTAAAVEAALAEQKRTFEMLLDVQLKAFQACVTTMMDSTNNRIDSFVKVMTRELTELKASVQFSQTELHEMKNNNKSENDRERYEHRSLQKLTADFRRMDDNIDYLENQSRRNNLRIDGVKERAEETWADTEQALRKVLETDLKMPADHVNAIAIERAHRTGGAQNAERDRTVVVKFTHFKDRDSVLQAARANRPRGVFVNEDFSMRVVSRRKELIPEMKEARDRGKIAYLSYDRLVVKDRQERHQR